MIVGPVSKGTWHLASEDSVQLNKVCVCVCVCVRERERERERERMGEYIQKDPRCEQFPGGWKVRLRFIQGQKAFSTIF